MRETIVGELRDSARKLRDLHASGADGARHESIYDFVLEHGRLYTGQRLPSRFRKGGFKGCFANSARMAERHRELTYVEGFANAPMLHGQIVHHAWCVDHAGMVYDRTWGFDAAREYFGVPFKLSLVRQLLRLSGEYSVLDRWEPHGRFLFENPEPYVAT
jgi:hypothetical protein